MNDIFFANQRKIDDELQSLKERCAGLAGTIPDRGTEELRQVVSDLITLIHNELARPLIVIKNG